METKNYKDSRKDKHMPTKVLNNINNIKYDVIDFDICVCLEEEDRIGGEEISMEKFFEMIDNKEISILSYD